jgi:hypothetical protein
MDKFLDNENKGLLWSILYEQGIFNNISSSELQNIKTIFEDQLNYTSKSLNSITENDLTLIDINKIAIKEISDKITKFKLRFASEPATFVNSKNVLNTQLKQEKQEKFNRVLENKQTEFNKLIQASKPDVPNFSEDMDKPFDKNNMETLLSDMMNIREKELNQVMQNTVNINDEKSDTPILKIGSDINSEFNVDDIYMNSNKKKVDKRVTFEIESDNKIIDDTKFTDVDLNANGSFKQSFIDKLKRLSNITENEYYTERLFNESAQENISIIEQLNKIQSNQGKLLELFNIINNKQNTILEKFNNLEKNNMIVETNYTD